MIAPCKGCPDRDYPHCHMVCERYKAYKAEREKISEAKREEATLTAARSKRFARMEHDWLMRRKRIGK